MDKKTWIIIGAIVAVFVGVIATSMLQNQSSTNYEQYDLATIIEPNDDSGNLSENIDGNPNAPVVIYEYGDYQCTACAPINPYINEIIEEYGDNVAVVLRTYIMDYHQNGTAAASAANAAALQGYWKPFKDLIYSKQNDWYYSEGTERQKQFEEYFTTASNGQGDLEKFREDMSSKAVAKKISFDRALATRANVDWTPTFYLGDELIDQRGMSTSDFLDLLRKKINEKLTAQGIELPQKAKTSEDKSK